MSGASAEQMETMLASEFDRQGWAYDLTLGTELLEGVKRAGRVDPDALASSVPAVFLQRNRTTRENLAAAISRAIGSSTLEAKEASQPGVSITYAGDVYELKIEGSQLIGSPINLGKGTQISLDGGSKEELLTALGAIVTSGLDGEWNPAAAKAVGEAIEARGDLTVEEARTAVLDAGQGPDVDRSRVSELVEKVAVSGLGNFLSTALGLGLADILHLLG